MKNFTAVIAASYIVFVSSSVCGQGISDIPNSAGLGETGLRAVERSTPVYDPEAAPLSGLSINFPTQQPPANAGELEFVLNGIEFDGTELLPADQISPLYSDLIGKKITLQQAFDVISAIQAVHRKSGHIFTRVIAPPKQSITVSLRYTLSKPTLATWSLSSQMAMWERLCLWSNRWPKNWKALRTLRSKNSSAHCY